MWKCLMAGVLSCLGSLFAKYAFSEVVNFDFYTIIFRSIMGKWDFI